MMLCTICKDVIHGFWLRFTDHPNINESAPHHSNYSSLNGSVTEGCSICCDMEDIIVGGKSRLAMDAVTPAGSPLTSFTIIGADGSLGPLLLFVKTSLMVPASGSKRKAMNSQRILSTP
jgi:hypothetical protein